jgi:hypothetical protein
VCLCQGRPLEVPSPVATHPHRDVRWPTARPSGHPCRTPRTYSILLRRQSISIPMSAWCKSPARAMGWKRTSHDAWHRLWARVGRSWPWPCKMRTANALTRKIITPSTGALPSGHPAHPGTRVGPVNTHPETLSAPVLQAWALCAVGFDVTRYCL